MESSAQEPDTSPPPSRNELAAVLVDVDNWMGREGQFSRLAEIIRALRARFPNTSTFALYTERTVPDELYPVATRDGAMWQSLPNGDIDTAIATAAAAELGHVELLVVVSGDGHILSVLDNAKRQGVSTIAIVAEETASFGVTTSADEWLTVDDLLAGRPPRPSEFASSISSSAAESFTSSSVFEGPRGSSAVEPPTSSSAAESPDSSSADDEPAVNETEREHVAWLDDDPVVSKADALGRDGVAMALDEQLRTLDREKPGRSFLVHIDGPWGAGKSTLMQFVRDRLAEPERFAKPEGKDRWLDIPYDAWRQSKAGPPWLTLLEAIRRAVRTDRGRFPARCWFSVRERARLVGRWQWIAAGIICLVIAGLVALAMNFGASDFTMTKMGDVTKFVAGTLSAITAVGLLAGSIGRFAALDSHRAAKAFLDNRADPMEYLAKHFRWVLSQARRPMLLLIDDLDRCPEAHVVDLLEAIQKLLRDHTTSNSGTKDRFWTKLSWRVKGASDARESAGTKDNANTKDASPSENARCSLVILVAADGRWVKTSYDNAYNSLAKAVSEPGASIGSLFLQKLFQLTLPVPRLSDALKAKYIAELLADRRNSPKPAADEGASPLAQDIERAKSSEEVLEMLDAASEVERLKVADRAIQLMVIEPDAQAHTRHVLEPFAELVDPTPRSLKRYVMAYSMLRAVRTAEGSAVKVGPLALWTVLVTRWPMLGDYLQRYPDAVRLFEAGDERAFKGVPPELVSLFTDPPDELRTVMNHEAGPLDAKRIRTCSGQGKKLESEAEKPALPTVDYGH